MADGKIELREGRDALLDVRPLVDRVAAQVVERANVGGIASGAPLKDRIGPAHDRKRGLRRDRRYFQAANPNSRQVSVDRPGRTAAHAEIASGGLQGDRQAIRLFTGEDPLDRVAGKKHGGLRRAVGAGEPHDFLRGGAADSFGPPGRACRAAIPPQHIPFEPIEARAMGVDEPAVGEVFRDEHVEDGQHQGRIGAGPAGDPPGVGPFGREGAARSDHDDRDAPPAGFDQPPVRFRAHAGFEDVRPPEHDHPGMPHRRRVMAGAGPVVPEEVGEDERHRPVAVVARQARASPEEVHEPGQEGMGAVQCSFCCEAAEGHYRSRAVLGADLPQVPGGDRQGLVPARLAKPAGAAGSRPDKRREDAVGRVCFQRQAQAARATADEPPAGRVVPDARHTPVLDNRQERAGIAAAVLTAECREQSHGSSSGRNHPHALRFTPWSRRNFSKAS